MLTFRVVVRLHLKDQIFACPKQYEIALPGAHQGQAEDLLVVGRQLRHLFTRRPSHPPAKRLNVSGVSGRCGNRGGGREIRKTNACSREHGNIDRLAQQRRCTGRRHLAGNGRGVARQHDRGNAVAKFFANQSNGVAAKLTMSQLIIAHDNVRRSREARQYAGELIDRCGRLDAIAFNFLEIKYRRFAYGRDTRVTVQSASAATENRLPRPNVDST